MDVSSKAIMALRCCSLPVVRIKYSKTMVLCRLASLEQVALAEEVNRRQQEIRDEEKRIREEDQDTPQVQDLYLKMKSCAFLIVCFPSVKDLSKIISAHSNTGVNRLKQ